ncbi:MAG: peptidylprolyl isomerase [Pseudomonadota bacterium]|nr:peptidylprolyl isomerase [Pseudomonadota bacterium]
MPLLLSLILFAPSVGWGAQPPGGDKDVVAKWGKKVVTRAELEARIAVLPPEYQNRFKNEQQRQEFLEGLVQVQILAAEARAQKLDKERAMVLRLEDMTNSVLAQEYMKRELAKVPQVTEKDIEDYYQSHKGEFVNPAQVKAQHILVKVDDKAKPEEIAAARAKAENIRKEIAAGGDFSKLAEKYSDDPGSKTRGGDLGFFARERMVPEFSQAAFSMKKDEVSQPVKTAFGFHIIKVTDTRPEKQLDLKEAAPRIRGRLENARRKEAMDKELERLKKKYNVRFERGQEAAK